MKFPSALLTLSLAANFGLLIAILTTTAGSTSAVSSPNHSPSTVKVSAGSPNSSASPSGGSSPLRERSATSSAPASLWESLRSDDLDALAARLKAAGFSFQEIRAIVSAYGKKQIDDARSTLTPNKTPYWKPRSDPIRSPEERTKLAELGQREYSLHLSFFSSPDAILHDEDATDYARERHGNLPLEKLQQLARIESDYDLLRSKLITDLTQGKERLTPEDRRQLAVVETERHRDIRDALTPDEYAEYSLHDSPTAQSLRDGLALLRLTESEYKALFALQRPIDEKFDQLTADDKSRQAYEASIKNLAPQIEAVLGPDRYAEYKHLAETGADQTTILMSRLQLPLSTAGKITALRDTTTEQAKTLRNDTSLSPAERDARLATLARETETKLGALLRTPRGLEAYSELKGDWLRALQPKPAHP